jgi:proteasome lid subunit RPN8/RPN11
MDEPLVWEDESSVVEQSIDVPKAFHYVGTGREAGIPDDFPKIYLDYGVAKKLQAEAQRSVAVNAEVGGILLGTTTGDGSLIKVSHIAIGRDEDSSPVHYKFSYSVWDDLIDQMEDMSKQSGEELLLVGWYHTHPNMAVFLSRYDLRTHRDFHRPYQFALVLAPRVGTEDTKVGFFVNRRGSTPLLPGLRLYDAPSGANSDAELPWQFQDVEAEGVEEGEKQGDGGDTRDQTPVVHQLGIVRREDPNWLMLGLDKAEGPVLPILEAMAAAVVHSRADRIGVLLGTQTSKNHVTINRVRFLGKLLDEDPSDERVEILGTLRFMARTFPAHGEQKILGLVRIVSPHRFSVGDIYDPLEHNIQVAALLGEVGYDLNEVPFQVGLVLYAGIEEDTLFFQVFAQHKTSRPVPLMSMRAMAPEYMRPNERYECIDGDHFHIEAPPSMSAPLSGIYKLVEAAPLPPLEIEPEDTATAADFAAVHVVDPDLEIGGTQRSNKVLVGAALGLLIAAIGTIAVLLPGGQTDVQTTQEAAADLDAVLASVGDVYHYTLTGCGSRWNPGVPCVVFSEEPKAKEAPLVTVDLFPAYATATFNPLDAWLVATGTDGSRLKLTRGKDGKKLVFSVRRGEARWDALWANEDPLEVRLVLAPRGAELELEDELTALRRTESFRILAARGQPDAAPDDTSGGLPPRSAMRAGNWAFAAGGLETSVRWDGRKETFASPVLVSGGGAGTWTLRVASKPGGTPLAESETKASGRRQDMSEALADLLTRPAVAATVSELVLRSGSAVFADLVPPDGPSLRLRVSVGAMMVEHKVCVMMAGPDGGPVEGQAHVNGGGMRPTFAPGVAGASECADGGKTGRWTAVTFGPGKASVEFVYEGSEPELAAGRGQTQFGLLSRKWSNPANGSQCLGVTITLGRTGLQKTLPTAEPLYSLIDGGCQ